MEYIYPNGNGVPELSLGTLLSRQSSRTNEGDINTSPENEGQGVNNSGVQPQGGCFPGVGEIIDCLA
jgi:hypothetical protein